jgi:hypothetical protein
MEFKKINLTTENLTALSLTDLTYWGRDYSTVADAYDAIEDAVDAEDACKRLNALKLLRRGWEVNRETDKYIRLTCYDSFDDRYFLFIVK